MATEYLRFGGIAELRPPLRLRNGERKSNFASGKKTSLLFVHSERKTGKESMSTVLPRLLTTRDLAKRLRRSPATIRRLVRQGILPTIDLGGRKLLFSPTAVAIALVERESTAINGADTAGVRDRG